MKLHILNLKYIIQLDTTNEMTAVSLHAPKHRSLNMAHQVAFKYWQNINLVLCNWALLRLFKASDITASRSYKLSLLLPSIPSSCMSPKNPLSNIINSSNPAFKLTHFIRWIYHQPRIQIIHTSSHIMEWQTHFPQTRMRLLSLTSSLLRQRDVCVFGRGLRQQKYKEKKKITFPSSECF